MVIKTKIIITFFALVLIAFYSCKKDKVDNLEAASITSDESSTADGIFDEVDDLAEVYEGAKKSVAEDYCTPTVTITYPEQTPFPRVVTIDFGTEGCKGRNGRTRKGKIISTVTGRFIDVGSKRIITFDEFYANDYKVEGTRTVSNTGRNNAENWTRSIEVDGKVTAPDGKVITRKSTRIREWIEGDATLSYFWDDVFSITGSASGVNSKGIAYTATITEALIKARDCRWIRKGKINIVTDVSNIVLDYGAGECDNIITISVNGEEREIKLKW